MRSAIDLVVRVEVTGHPHVRGSVESRYGQRGFSGWLELLGVLEHLVDRASDDAAQARRGCGPGTRPAR